MMLRTDAAIYAYNHEARRRQNCASRVVLGLRRASGVNAIIHAPVQPLTVILHCKLWRGPAAMLASLPAPVAS